MSCYIRWEFYGHNGEKAEFLTEDQVKALIALDEYDLEELEWEEEYLFGYGQTASHCAYDRIEEALDEFAKIYPDVSIKALAFYETDTNPIGFLVEHGKCIPLTGKITYYRDDNGEEVII